jgi:hypothetical protein
MRSGACTTAPVIRGAVGCGNRDKTSMLAGGDEYVAPKVQ